MSEDSAARLASVACYTAAFNVIGVLLIMLDGGLTGELSKTKSE